MTVHVIYKLYCTSCGKEYNEASDESADQVRGWAFGDDWKYIRVENGSMWDFCPRCYKERNMKMIKTRHY